MKYFVVIIAFILFGCSQSIDEKSAASLESEPIVIALRNDVKGFEPGVSRDVFTDDVYLHLYEGLVTYNENGDVIPLLANSVEVDDSATEYRFELRSDVIFHNGEALTPDIVVWNYTRMFNTNGNWLCRSWYDGSRGLEVVSILPEGEHHVVMKLNTPDSSFLDKLANIQCGGFVLHPESFNAKGKFLEPIGTGPYSLRTWEMGEYVLLERHQAYHSQGGEKTGLGGGKSLDAQFLKWQVIPDTSAGIAGLLSGQLDMAGRLDSSNLFDLNNAESIVVHKQQSLDWNTLLMQTNDALLADKNLRLAIAHALDLNTMAEVVSAEISTANPSVVAQLSAYHDQCHEAQYKFDIEIAKTYLNASSYDGQPLVMQTNKRFLNMYDNALLMQSMLSEIGINVTLEVLEWTTQIDNYLKGDFQLMSFGYSGRTDPLLAYEAILGNKQKHPYFQWQSDEARELLNKSMEQVDKAKRKETFCQVHNLMIEDVPMLNLYNHYIIDASTERLVGYKPYALQIPRFWGVSLSESGAE